MAILKKPVGGKNKKACGDANLEHLSDFLSHGVQSELGFPCGHRRLQRYCTEQEIDTIGKLHRRYKEHEPSLRKMEESSFREYLKTYHFVSIFEISKISSYSVHCILLGVRIPFVFLRLGYTNSVCLFVCLFVCVTPVEL